jgi:hypothetical protein
MSKKQGPMQAERSEDVFVPVFRGLSEDADSVNHCTWEWSLGVLSTIFRSKKEWERRAGLPFHGEVEKYGMLL